MKNYQWIFCTSLYPPLLLALSSILSLIFFLFNHKTLKDIMRRFPIKQFNSFFYLLNLMRPNVMTNGVRKSSCISFWIGMYVQRHYRVHNKNEILKHNNQHNTKHRRKIIMKININVKLVRWRHNVMKKTCCWLNCKCLYVITRYDYFESTYVMLCLWKKQKRIEFNVGRCKWRMSIYIVLVFSIFSFSFAF